MKILVKILDFYETFVKILDFYDFLELHIYLIWSSLVLYIFSPKLEDTSGFLRFYRYHHNSFALWFYTILTWFMLIFMSRIPESGFLSGSPVFQKVHIWNLHVMGSFRVQKFSRTNLVRGPVLLRNDGFSIFSIIHHIYTYKTIRK